MTEPRYIIHVDMDAFFASVEQRDHPEYGERPVVVGADPQDGRGRGVVSTCSYEARRFGIHSAMPISTAYRKCPHAVFLPADMEKYAAVSGRIFAALREFTPVVEEASIDEAFLDISDTYRLFGTPLDTARSIKRRIREATSLTASVGLAPTKMAAKIASGVNKPDGLVEIKEDRLLDFLRPLGVGKLWGVGPKTEAVMSDMGIRTIGDLARRTEDELTAAFGRNGAWFWEMARGIDASEVVTGRETKSISNETTFPKDTGDKSLIMSSLARLCESVAERLRDSGIKCRTLTLKIRLSGFRTYTRSSTMAEPTNYAEIFIKEIRRLYVDFEAGNQGQKVRLVGVRSSKLSPAADRDLFTVQEDSKKENMHKALDEIRHRFGGGSIRRAAGE